MPIVQLNLPQPQQFKTWLKENNLTHTDTRRNKKVHSDINFGDTLKSEGIEVMVTKIEVKNNIRVCSLLANPGISDEKLQSLFITKQTA